MTAAYIVAAILFIFSLAGLSKHETSQQGNNFGIAGMAIALIATIFGPDTGNVAWILVAMIIGGAIGIRLAKRVEMTEMPELVAILHSFVGLAAVLVGFNRATGEHCVTHPGSNAAQHCIKRTELEDPARINTLGGQQKLNTLAVAAPLAKRQESRRKQRL